MKLAVVVGRFQVEELTEGHKKLIDEALKYDKVLLVIGRSPVRNTRRNPLSCRLAASAVSSYLLEHQDFRKVDLASLLDQPCDKAWSRRLDQIIEENLIDGMSPILLGGRDSFIDYYHGIYPTKIINIYSDESGTESRKKTASITKLNADFRSGVIWAAYQRYPVVYSTVDIIPYDRILNKVLIGRKVNEKAWRFIGGFLDRDDDTLIRAAQRELFEEAQLNIHQSQIVYINSCQVKDWRYTGEDDVVMTHIFTCDVSSEDSDVMAGDDIEEVKWVEINDEMPVLTPSHQNIYEIFNDWNKQNG